MAGKKSLLESLKDKRVRHGGYAAVISASVLIGLVVVNLLVQQIPAQIDMTESKLFSLTEQTEKLIEDVSSDVTIYALYQAGKESKEVVQVLEKYAQKSEFITLEFLDIDRNPGFVSRFREEDQQDIGQGSVIVMGKEGYRIIGPYQLYDFTTDRSGRRKLIGFRVEERISSAIKYVTSGYEPTIYQLTGHGEYTFQHFGIMEALNTENYTVKKLDLITSTSVPEDASILVIMSPKNDLNEAEADKIREYINNGGKGLFMFDFLSFEFFPVLGGLLQSFGLEIQPGVVMERKSENLYTKENPFLLAPDFTDHEVLQPLQENSMSVLIPNCMGIRELEMKKRRLEIKPIFTSSSSSWLRTVDDGTRDRLPSDIEGPINLMVSVTDLYEPQEGLRLIVSGTTGILNPIPPFGQIKGNIELLLNGLSWVNNREETISIESKSLFKMPLSISGLGVFIYSGIVVIIIPLTIIVIGLIVWLRRRHL